MFGNILLGFISVILTFSPYLARNAYFDNLFRFQSLPNARNWFEGLVITLGSVGIGLSLFYTFIKKKNGSIHVLIAVVILMIGFFFNQERIPLPMRNNLLGGEMFFIFLMSFTLAVAGAAVEWLMD